MKLLGKSNQFKKGVLELCVLYLLKNKDRYGYEITQLVNKNIPLTEGALYPILRRFVKEGYCVTYLKESKGGPYDTERTASLSDTISPKRIG